MLAFVARTSSDAAAPEVVLSNSAESATNAPAASEFFIRLPLIFRSMADGAKRGNAEFGSACRAGGAAEARGERGKHDQVEKGRTRKPAQHGYRHRPADLHARHVDRVSERRESQRREHGGHQDRREALIGALEDRLLGPRQMLGNDDFLVIGEEQYRIA